MPEFKIDETGYQTQYLRPDEDGFTVRTKFNDDPIIESVRRRRSVDPKPRAVPKDGVCYRFVGSIPQSVIHAFYMREKRYPESHELAEMLRSREFSRLRGTEEKF